MKTAEAERKLGFPGNGEKGTKVWQQMHLELLK